MLTPSNFTPLDLVENLLSPQILFELFSESWHFVFACKVEGLKPLSEIFGDFAVYSALQQPYMFYRKTLIKTHETLYK